MKRMLACILTLLLILTSCGKEQAPEEPEKTEASPEAENAGEAETVELTLAAYPVGGWGNSSTISAMSELRSIFWM